MSSRPGPTVNPLPAVLACAGWFPHPRSKAVDGAWDKSDQAWQGRYLPAVMGPVTFSGHVYGVPYNNTQPEVVLYNKAMFAQYHLTIPTTWPQLLQVVKTRCGRADGAGGGRLCPAARPPRRDGARRP